MKMFAVHSLARARGNRTARAAAPSHRGLIQFVGPNQQRLVRTRPLMMTEDQLIAALPDLKEKASRGFLEVRSQDGRKIDLETLAPISPVAPSVPLPNPPLDTAAADVNGGENIPQMVGGVPEMLAADAPVIPPEFMPEPETEQEEVEVDFKPPTPAQPQQFHHHKGKGRR